MAPRVRPLEQSLVFQPKGFSFRHSLVHKSDASPLYLGIASMNRPKETFISSTCLGVVGLAHMFVVNKKNQFELLHVLPNVVVKRMRFKAMIL